jgi:hypothetical protein
MVVIEAQTAIDARKRVSWPLYIAGVHARQGCDVVLVIIALDPEVAAWARQPISIGDGCMVVTPRVIGPESIPVITDFEVARRSPEMAVLSVAAHADEPGTSLRWPRSRPSSSPAIRPRSQPHLDRARRSKVGRNAPCPAARA